MALRGHEWIGGAAGFDNRHHAPQNSSLLLVGIISGSKNFDVRSWLRRAFWQQRPWRLGVEWRFVVGTRLPRGDNDRVSLHYEAARHGDLDLIQGSEVPPRQARVAMRWWLKAAAYVDQAQADGSGTALHWAHLQFTHRQFAAPRTAPPFNTARHWPRRRSAHPSARVRRPAAMGAVDRRRDGTLDMALRAHDHATGAPRGPPARRRGTVEEWRWRAEWSDAQAGGAWALLVLLLSDGRVTNLVLPRCGARASAPLERASTPRVCRAPPAPTPPSARSEAAF